MKAAIVMVLGLVGALNAGAVDEGYLTIKSVKVELLNEEVMTIPAAAEVAIGTEACENSGSSIFKPPAPRKPRSEPKKDKPFLTIDIKFPGLMGASGGVPGPLDELDGMVDKILNIGKKIWTVVEAGRPVVNFRSDVASALPMGTRCWLDLQGWEAPKSYTYGVTFENAFGSEVIHFKYRAIYVYGGSVNGKGKYLGYVAMQPMELNVAWGYKFDAYATVPSVFNQGTRAEPVAGMQLNMNWKIETVLKKIEQTQAYFVNGKGTFQQLQ